MEPSLKLKQKSCMIKGSNEFTGSEELHVYRLSIMEQLASSVASCIYDKRCIYIAIKCSGSM